MAAPCYAGPDPVKKDQYPVIWKWAKEHGIDQGLSYDKIHDAINEHFYAGMAKPEWINNILGARKTPLRVLSTDRWVAQYNRRMIQQYAKNLTQTQALGPINRILAKLFDLPRRALVQLHGFVFPITHAGDLLFRPASWRDFFNIVAKTYTNIGSKAATERVVDSMRRDSMYATALRSGLAVGPKSLTTDLINRGGLSERAWDMLRVGRFDMWKRALEKHISPSMGEAEILDIGKNLAIWANHATGSGEGKIAALGGKVLFGPALTQSKLNRMFADPIHTVRTFANWNNASPGEKIVARTRLSGMTQYALTGLGFLAANQGFLSATGSKQKINFDDPSKSDWMLFKGFGLEGGFPGLHSELRTIAQILAVPFIQRKDIRHLSYGKAKSAGEYLQQLASDYAWSKAAPAISLGKELFAGEAFPARPLPWSGEKGTPAQPKYNWFEYLASKGPIFSSAPVKYIYDQIRAHGANPGEARDVVNGLITYGLRDPKTWAMLGAGFTGFHVRAEKGAKPIAQRPTAITQNLLGDAIRRERAARALMTR
jgi:hypothetical protein